jgi:hypothetical protein
MTITTTVTRVDSFEPDYEGECDSCSAPANEQPLVTAWKHGRMIHHTHMCGPCTWGEADMIDPRRWNE